MTPSDFSISQSSSTSVLYASTCVLGTGAFGKSVVAESLLRVNAKRYGRESRAALIGAPMTLPLRCPQESAFPDPRRFTPNRRVIVDVGDARRDALIR